MKKKTIPYILEKYKSDRKLTTITAYDATFAKLADASGIDMILVGDSLGMVIQGHESTVPVTLEDVIYHTRCVSRGVENALVIADLPFMSYQASKSQALLSAGRAMKEGRASAVKLEGGLEMTDTVRLMVAAGIPVMGHIGLRPQRVHMMGGYKIQGKTEADAKILIDEAKGFENAGAFAIVIEGVAIETAREITSVINIPTIGISSGPYCSGQVLVLYDMLGLNSDFNPKFLKKYVNGEKIVTDAIREYINDIETEKFPTEGHGFGRK